MTKTIDTMVFVVLLAAIIVVSIFISTQRGAIGLHVDNPAQDPVVGIHVDNPAQDPVLAIHVDNPAQDTGTNNG